MRVLALALLLIAALALLVFHWWSFRRHWLPQMTRPAQGWLWEQPWHRQVLVWGTLVVGLAVAVVLAIIIVPPDGGWSEAFKALLLAPAVIAAILQKRRNRREGVGAPPPFMRHGPPGWTWDGESATWRRPE